MPEKCISSLWNQCRESLKPKPKEPKPVVVSNPPLRGQMFKGDELGKLSTLPLINGFLSGMTGRTDASDLAIFDEALREEKQEEIKQRMKEENSQEVISDKQIPENNIVPFALKLDRTA